jgi:nucleotide-binding universal stress UspA family protein
MFERILVPVDGSTRAERAIPVAARIARASGGSVILVRVVSAPITLCPSPVQDSGGGQAAIDTHLSEGEKYLLALTKSPDLDGVPTETMVLSGPVASTLLTVTRSSRADLVVLCSHGYTGMTHWVLGSVAEKVARHAPVPVLVLRECGPVPAGLHPDPTHPLRVLVALDGSARAKTALEPAASLVAALAAPGQGALHLVRVVKPTASDGEEKDLDEGTRSEPTLNKAKRYLSATVEHLRVSLVAPAVASLKLPVTWSVAVDADVASALIRVAENGEDAAGAGIFGGCDIIAMATHGRAGMHHWAMGSITERVLHATRLPLLIVRPPDMMDKSSVTWEKATLSAQG